jgi:hypothetical protein
MGYYVMVYNYGLPKISRLLKLRARLLSQQSSGLSSQNSGGRDTIQHDSILVDQTSGSVQVVGEPSLLADCAHYLNTSVAGASEWCNTMVAELNANQLESANKKYVKSLTEMNLSHQSKCKALANLTALTSDSIRVTGSFKTSNKVSNWKSSIVGGASVLNALLILRLRKHSLLYLKQDPIDKKQLSSKQKSKSLSQSKIGAKTKLNKKNA